MNDKAAKAILMYFRNGEFLDEKWLIRHAGATIELLDEMVKAGWLIKKEKDLSDFMSDNRYAITELGRAFA